MISIYSLSLTGLGISCNLIGVIHTAVTDFESVVVKYFAEAVILRPRQPYAKTDSETTFSGTTLHTART